MLLLRLCKISAVAAFMLAALLNNAAAGLYGFHHYNPYTRQERILNSSTIPQNIFNYRKAMRDNLLMLIRYAKAQNPAFKIITHEGQDLLTKSRWEYDREGYNRARLEAEAKDDSFLFHHNFTEQEPKRYTDAYDYLQLVDAVALNNLYCGKGKENQVAKNHGLSTITIEQCADQNALEGSQVSAMIDKKITYGFTSLADAFNNTGDHNSLNDSSKNIEEVDDAQNILIITDDSRYSSKEAFVADLLKTNYDIIIMKPLFANHERFDAEDLRRLHFKRNGSKRMLIAELNVSETSPQDYFWQKDWAKGSPSWLVRESFSSPDGIIVRYWDPEWQKIISRYFKDIVNEGFDGIFFTGVENYHYFEDQNPLE